MAETKKKGNPAWHKGMKSPNPGGASKNALALSSKLVRDIGRAYDQLGGVDYLVKLGETEPRLFAALLNKILPTQVSAEHTLNIVHIGEALQRATQRLEQYNAQIIDVTPSSENDGTKEQVTHNKDSDE